MIHAGRKKGQRSLLVAGLGALAGGVIVAGVMFAARPAPPVEQREVVQFTVNTAPDSRLTGANGAARFAVSPNGLQSESDRQPMEYLDGFNGGGASLSPDGRWLAYAAGTGPQSQVFVQSFPDPSRGKVAASGPGAAYPRWNPKGGELFFVDNARRVMVAPVNTIPKLEVGLPVALFDIDSGGGSNPIAFMSPFDVMPDGARFVAVRPTGALNSTTQSIIVTVNGLNGSR